MKRLLLILILTFSFQSWAKADDIRDFQIEGMSIGDSLLNFITKDQIENQKKTWYPTKEYFIIFFPEYNNSQEYNQISISMKNGDNNYEIKALGGTIFYQKNIEECYSQKDKIVKDLSDVFKDITDKRDMGTFILSADDSGKSNASTVNFYFENDSLISVQCKDWSEELGYWDRLKVTLVSREYFQFTERAYE